MEKKLLFNRIISFVLAAMLILSALLLFAACGEEEWENDANLAPKGYIPTDAKMFVDELGYESIMLTSDRDIKILQITDMHIADIAINKDKDKKAIDAVKKLIEHTVPDLIVATGDCIYPLNGSKDNLSALRVVANLFESYKTPWTMCFGNHDAEWMAQAGKEELCNYLENVNLKYCLFTRGPAEADGEGNQIINVYNRNGTVNSSVFLFDTSEYAGATQISGYKAITQGQANWYEKCVKQVSALKGEVVNSYLFYHVPQREYKLAWSAYKEGKPNAKYFFGDAGESNDKISSPKEVSALYEKMVTLGSAKGVFCGHNHLNYFSVEFQGIRYTFSRSIDFLAYPGISSKTEQRGATLLTLKGRQSTMTEEFDIESIKLSDIK